MKNAANPSAGGNTNFVANFCQMIYNHFLDVWETVFTKNEEKSEKAQLKQREVFLSRQTENLPATLIRGKCSVTLLSEVENAQSYLSRDDAFFYALVYDPHAKTLVANRGEIHIGSN